jgi:hypothetical protein
LTTNRFPASDPNGQPRSFLTTAQLALYREALKKLKLPVASIWIHFAIGGGLVEVLLDGKAC